MDARVVGTIDGFQLPTQVRGWAKRLDDSTEPVRLRFVRNGVTFAEAVPDQVRRDITERSDGRSGFACELPGTDDLLDLLLGRAVLIVESAGVGSSEATVWDYGRAVGLAQVLQFMLRDTPSAAHDVLATVVAGIDDALPLRPILDRLLQSQIAKPGSSIPPPDTAAPVPSSVPVPVGTPSGDQTAVVGQDGWLFLVGGSNDLLSRYGRTSADIADQKRTAAGWIDLHRRRVDAYAGSSRRFIQMMVPEKTSSLAGKLPFRIEAPTYCLGKIERTLAEDPHYLSVASLIPTIGAERFYRRTDTHPSAEGNFAMIRGIAERLEMLEVVDDLEVRFEDRRIEVGDLAERFFGVPILETLPHPGSALLDALQPAVKSSFGSETRRTKSGTLWRTPGAPIDLRLAVFGNSVFEHGETPLNLAWWCARLFREFYFFWLPETLPDSVREIGADVVIAQTVERFLFAEPPAI